MPSRIANASPILALLLLFLSFVFYFALIKHCSPEPVQQVEPKNGQQQPSDLYKVKHNLSGSDYYLDVEITKIDFKEHFGAYEDKEDKYTAPKPISGMEVSIWFKMTNPYPKQLIIPVPEYFYLTSESFSEKTMTPYSKLCSCSQSWGHIFTADGEELSKSIKNIDHAYRFPLNLNESKEFKVVMKYAIPFFIPTVNFRGFSVGSKEKAKTQTFNIDTRTGKIYDKYSIAR